VIKYGINFKNNNTICKQYRRNKEHDERLTSSKIKNYEILILRKNIPRQTSPRKYEVFCDHHNRLTRLEPRKMITVTKYTSLHPHP
jgi:hypothetical protein